MQMLAVITKDFGFETRESTFRSPICYFLAVTSGITQKLLLSLSFLIC